jgi:hypothetical protein
MRVVVVLGVVVGAALLVAGVGPLIGGDDSRPGPPRGTHAVPASIASDCSRDVEVELSRFIDRAPTGSTVGFPAGGCYAQGNRIEVRDKRSLTIDGNGSTFRSTAENTGKRSANPNWLILRGRDIRLEDMKLVGNFHLTGARSQQRVNQASTEGEAGATSQPNAGIGIYGGNGVHVADVDIRDVFGDGVLTAVSEYVDGSVASQTPRDVHVERVTVKKTARHCFSPNQVVGFWLEDSSGQDCWYGALDAELDAVGQQLRDVHVLRNTFSDFNLLGVMVPVAGDGDGTRDIEIRDNRFLTYPDQPCNTIVEVGTYPANPNTFRNVVVEGNSMKAHGVGVAFDHVAGGAIRDNRIAYSDVGCARPNTPSAVRVTHSMGVTVAGNRRSRSGR